MDFWQQYQGFVWVGLLIIVVPALGVFIRRRTRRLNSRIREQGRLQTDPTFVAQQAAVRTESASADLSAVLLFPASVATMAPYLSGMKLPAFWVQSGATQWQTPLSKTDPTPAAIVVLEDFQGGSRLALVRADQLADRVTTLPEWNKIRANATKAASAAGMSVSEGAGPQLHVVATLDTTGTPLDGMGFTRLRWERASS